MKFLIPTEPDDSHAILVKLALERDGHEVTLLFTADLPTRSRNSVYVDDECFRWKSADRYNTVVDHDYDVVWWRRARKPHLPKSSVNSADYTFALRENCLFHDSFTWSLAPNARWINPKESANRANDKLLQLKVARECGLTIPVTLCSNDPKEIRYFVLAHEAQGVIYKPLCANFWVEDQGIKIVYTSRIHFIDLPKNQMLQHVPGIFQQEVPKQHELRVTCFGDDIVAAKLDSQVHADGKVDWRAIRDQKLNVSPVALPTELQDKIRLVMSRLGIVFGAFDFIVTPDNDYVFLEVNEQGQFLWLEDYNAEFPMLDRFVNFLTHSTLDVASPRHRLVDYKQQVAAIYHKNLRRHVAVNHLPMAHSSNQGGSA